MNKSSSRLIDLKGKRIGNFIVLEIDKTHNSSYSYWKCKCVLCDRIKAYRSDVLRKRIPSSCGCKSKAVKTGDRYGYIEVLELLNKKTRSPYWKCKCICGKIIERTSNALRQINNPSCGCKKNPKGNNHPSYIGYKDLSGSLIDRIKRGAVSRNISFNLETKDLQELLEKQKYKCNLSGLEIALCKENITASLDRIDSDKGYEIENVQWVHRDVNLMKNKLDQNKFIEICRLIAEKDCGSSKCS